MNARKKEILEKLSAVYKEYEPCIPDYFTGSYVRFIVETYEYEFNAFAKKRRTDRLPLMDVVCSIEGQCPTCDSAVVSSKGVTLLPEDIINAELTDGLNTHEKDFLKRYNEEVCLFQYHCPCCGSEWKSVDAYADLEELAFFLSTIDQFIAEKGICKDEIENYLKQRYDQDCEDCKFPTARITMGL